jgi:hypothetical protein
LDAEKRDLVIQVFSELSLDSGELKYTAKEGFDVFLKRFSTSNWLFGSADYLFSELINIYLLVKISMLKLQGFGLITKLERMFD